MLAHLLAFLLLGAPSAGREALVVLNKSDATASLLDAATGEALAVLPTGAGPHEVAVRADGALAVVSDYGEATPGRTLSVLDLAGRRLARTIDLGAYRRPHGLAWVPRSGRLLVTVEAQAAVLEVDVDEGKVLRALPTRAQTSHMVAVAPDGERAFVANIVPGTVTALDLASGEVLAEIEAGAGCEGIDVAPDGGEVWTANRAAGTLSVLDARSLETRATLDAPGFPIRVKLTPDGKRALVSCAQAGEVCVFDVAERRLLAAIGLADLAGEAGGTMLGAGFQGPVPIGIQVHPDGATAWVAGSGLARVAVLDLGSLALRGSYPTGRQPDGLGFSRLP